MIFEALVLAKVCSTFAFGEENHLKQGSILDTARHSNHRDPLWR